MAAGRSQELMSFVSARAEEYGRLRLPDESWSDAARRYLENGSLRDEPLELGVVERPDPDWPFEVSRRVVREELIAGVDRKSSYGERVEWVSQHLDDPLVRPSTAPCNAAWSMLVWAQENRKVDAEEREILEDTSRFLEILNSFECFTKLSAAVRGGEYDVYRGM
jgi:hypothetical protein